MFTRWRGDILQTHGYKPSAAARLLHSRAPIPWIGFFHGSTTESVRARFYHALDRRLLLKADRIVVMSNEQMRRFSAAGDRVRVIYNAVRSTRSGDGSRVPSMAALPRPRIAVVGRLSPEKGVDVFLDAMARLRRQGITASGVIVGDGPLRARLAARTNALGLTDRVLYTGHLPSADPIYGLVDLLVIPSRSEGLPNVLLEALGAGLPVVATRVGAIPDVLGDPAAGFLVKPGSAPELATAIEHALVSLEDTNARSARERVVRRFAQPIRDEALVSLYREVLQFGFPDSVRWSGVAR